MRASYLHATEFAGREGCARAQIDGTLYTSCHCQEAPCAFLPAQLHAIAALTIETMNINVSLQLRHQGL